MVACNQAGVVFVIRDEICDVTSSLSQTDESNGCKSNKNPSPRSFRSEEAF
jgi:hypothetical protein